VWCRIFCRNADEAPPSVILNHLSTHGIEATGHFKGDDLGWTQANISFGPGSPIMLQRYLEPTDNLRDDLNSWAAYIETLTYSPNYTILMERVIQTKQMLTIRKPIDHPNEIAMKGACDALCTFFSQRGDGIYMVDHDGWYDASGELLIQEY
jgi:hypothetical protein